MKRAAKLSALGSDRTRNAPKAKEDEEALARTIAALGDDSASSASASSDSEDQQDHVAYESGDSADMDVDSDSESAISSGETSSAPDASDSHSEHEDPTEEQAKLILSKMQLRLKESIDEDLDSVAILPDPSSALHDIAQAESAVIRNHLKSLKTVIESLSPANIRIQSKKAKHTSSDASSPSPANYLHKNTEFDAYSFLKAYFSELGGESLAKELVNELETAPEQNEAPKSKKDKSQDASPASFEWNAPTSVNVVGSYLLGTALRRKDAEKKNSKIALYDIDLAVTMPTSLFKKSDLKGHRYETKKLLFAAVLGAKLQAKMRALNPGNDNAEDQNDSDSLPEVFTDPRWACDDMADLASPYLQLSLTFNIGESNGKDNADDQHSTKSHKKRNHSASFNGPSRHVCINIRPTLTPTTFSATSLLPWKPLLAFKGNLPGEEHVELYQSLNSSIADIKPSSPACLHKASRQMVAQHNQRILSDMFTTTSTREVAEALRAMPAMKSAITLASRFIRSRLLSHPFNTYVISSLFVHTYASGLFKPSMTTLDLFKTWLQWIAKEKLAALAKLAELEQESHGVATSATRNIHTTPPILVSANKKASVTAATATNGASSSETWRPAFLNYSDELLKQSFAECFEVVLIDSTGYINVLRHVSASAWSQLEFEATLALHILEKPDQFAFATLFRTAISHSDKSIQLSERPPVASEFDIWLNAVPQQAQADLDAPALPSLSPIALAKTLTIYQKAKAQVSQKLQSKAIVGSHASNAKAAEITSLNPASSADALEVNDAKTKEANKWLTAEAQSVVKFNALDALVWQKIGAEILLFRSLIPRVEYAQFFHSLSAGTSSSQSSTKSLSSASWESWSLEDSMPAHYSLNLGLRVRPTQWQRLLEYGPQAQQEEAVQDFVRTWGEDRTGLRKFKDGMILHCVTWGIPPTGESLTQEQIETDLSLSANKHRIVKQVVHLLLNRHFVGADQVFWHLEMFGDEVMYEKLLAAERVVPALVGPVFKTSIRPVSLADAHDSVLFVWTQLQKTLRAIKGLSMNIKTLSMRGPLVRGTSASPPHYNPLCDVEIPLAQRQHASKESSTASQLCPASIPCVIVFESSSAWPTDLEAISHIKTAILLELSQAIAQQFGSSASSRTSPETLHIFFKGYAFKFEIFHAHELVLRDVLFRQAIVAHRVHTEQRVHQENVAKWQKQQKILEDKEMRGSIVPLAPLAKSEAFAPLTPTGMKTERKYPPIEPLPSVKDKWMEMNTAPKVSNLIHSLGVAYPAYGPTCVLVKKWMAAHLLPLAEFAEGMLVDLLVARLFQASPFLASPWAVPAFHPYTAFLRALYFFANLTWEAGPVIVPLHELHHTASASTLLTTAKSHENAEKTHSSAVHLGWSLDKIEQLQARWHRLPTIARPVLAIYFADGSSSISTDTTEESAAEEALETGIDPNDSTSTASSATTAPHKLTKITGVAQLFYGTNSDSTTHHGYRVDRFFAKVVLNRLKRLAHSALAHINGVSTSLPLYHGLRETHENLQDIAKVLFEPSLLDFDVVIELKRSALTHCLSLNVDPKKKSQGNASSKKNQRHIGDTAFLEAPADYVKMVDKIQLKSRYSSLSAAASAPSLLVDFDPVKKFVEHLADRFGERSLVFHDGIGGHLIGLVLKPSSFTPSTNISTATVMNALPIGGGEGKKANVVPNIVQMLNEVWSLGDGLVSQVHLVGGQHKLK